MTEIASNFSNYTYTKFKLDIANVDEKCLNSKVFSMFDLNLKGNWARKLEGEL